MKAKTILTFILSLIFMFSAMPNYAITADEAMAKFRSRMYGAGGLSGTLSWGYETDMQYSASFKYLPGKIYIKFSNPSGKIIVCNGRKLWVYNQANNICGVQDMAGGSGGLAGLLVGYNGIVTSQGSGGYNLKLSKPGSAYPEVILRLDSTFFPRSVSLKDASGSSLRFMINLDSGPVMNSQFEFNVPSNAQVVKNPLEIK